MARFVFVSTLYLFLRGVQLQCPILKDIDKTINVLNYSIPLLTLYQYKSVDPQIQSPFQVSEGASRSMTLQYLLYNKFFMGFCAYLEKVDPELPVVPKYDSFPQELEVIYKKIFLSDLEMRPNNLKLQYSNELLNCKSTNKITEISIIDFNTSDPQYISFYGCKMLVVDGSHKKFEGVLIFSSNGGSKRNIFELSEKLNNTYLILENEANVSRSSLRTVEKFEYKVTPDSCNDIPETETICQKDMRDNKIRGHMKLIKYIGIMLFVVIIIIIRFFYMIDFKKSFRNFRG